MKSFHRRISVFFALVLLLSLTLTGTFCWQGVNQQALNEVRPVPDMATVELVKLESDTNIPLSGVGFLLYRSDGTQVGGLFTTNVEGKITVALPAGEYWFEEREPAPNHGFDWNEDGTAKTRYDFTVSEENAKNKETVKVGPVYNPLLTGTRISGEKTWDLRGYTGVSLPSSIWVKLYQGDVLFSRVKVEPDESGKWLYSFTVPEFGADGSKFCYRVEEEPVVGFEAVYEQGTYNILNQYIPSSKPDPGPDVPDPTPDPVPTPTPDPEPTLTPTPDDNPTPTPGGASTPSLDVPKTGDDRRPALWLILAVMSFGGLASCVWYAKTHRYRGKRGRR